MGVFARHDTIHLENRESFSAQEETIVMKLRMAHSMAMALRVAALAATPKMDVLPFATCVNQAVSGPHEYFDTSRQCLLTFRPTRVCSIKPTIRPGGISVHLSATASQFDRSHLGVRLQHEAVMYRNCPECDSRLDRRTDSGDSVRF